MNNKGLGPGLVRGESMLLISKRNRARAPRIMVKSPGKSQERQRLKPMKPFQFGELRQQLSR